MHYVHGFLTGHLVLPFFSAFFILGPAAARLVNITVDDQNPDPLTGNTFTYSPSDHWEIGNGCQSCAARLDPSQTLDATWHDATYFASVSGSEVQTASLQFTGEHSFSLRIRITFNLVSVFAQRFSDLCIWNNLAIIHQLPQHFLFLLLH